MQLQGTQTDAEGPKAQLGIQSMGTGKGAAEVQDEGHQDGWHNGGARDRRTMEGHRYYATASGEVTE